MKQISSGAEAIIYKDEELVHKVRIAKPYRVSQIDDVLRKARTKREAKILEKLAKSGFPTAAVVNANDNTIIMSFVPGERLRDCLTKANYKALCPEIGRLVAKLHSLDIMHGDLTTSNMILGPDKKVYFIDFGLSLVSARVEDKAVDLHLLRQALESKHYEFWEDAFKLVIKAYSKGYSGSTDVLERLKVVEERGRNKKKMGG